MLHRIAALGVLAPLILLACATPYRNEARSSLTGGAFRDEGPGKLVRIGFSGNGYTKSATVAQYAVFRAAELAQERGKPYFLLYRNLRDGAADRPSGTPNVGIVGGHPTALGYVLLLDQQRPNAIETASVLRQRDALLAAESRAQEQEEEGR